MNPRTPAGQAPQACAFKAQPWGLFDLAWQLGPAHGRAPALFQVSSRTSASPGNKGLKGFPTQPPRPTTTDCGKTFNSARPRLPQRSYPGLSYSRKWSRPASGNPPPKNKKTSILTYTRLGPLGTTPGLGQPGRPRKRGLETPQMVRSNPLRDSDRKDRVYINQPSVFPVHQRGSPQPANRPVHTGRLCQRDGRED